MQKIIPHLWFDTQAKEATEFYTTLFKNSEIKNVTQITNTPSGDCDIVNFQLEGLEFTAISAGPYFKFNPSISLFIACDNEEEIDELWNKLIDGGRVLMPYSTYPWSKKYGWVEDKYGLSWQLSFTENYQAKQKITPLLMFTQDMAGRANEAIKNYVDIFPNSKIEMLIPYTKEDADKEGFIKHSRFTLDGLELMAMDSSAEHNFIFNEAFSLVVKCENQEEIDFYWEKLSAVPEAEQCGWLKDKYEVSWQIVPKELDEMMTSKDRDKVDRVTQAFLKMKKFDVEKLSEAYRG